MKPNRKRSKKLSNLSSLDIPEFKSLTEGQAQARLAYDAGKHLILTGYAGTGKTFLALNMAAQSLDRGEVSRIHIFRSAVASRDIGFLPGTEAEKMSVYERAYRSLFSEIFSRSDAWEVAKSKGAVTLESTSFLRGTTYSDCVIVVDEAQNLSVQEITTVLTRVGENCRVIICGDDHQCDLPRGSGWTLMMKIVEKMKDDIAAVEFGPDDIVRSGFVKRFILAWAQLAT